MELSINDLLKGKATVIKDHEFLSTEAYVEPFLERMSKFTSDFRVQAKLPNQISLTKSEDQSMKDTVFNRVWIQAVMPEEYSFENHQEVVGLVYGLDAKKPVAKVYRGALNMACLNLCVFDPSFLDVQEIEPNKPLNFKCVNSLMEQVSDIKMWLDKLSNTEIPYDYEGINERLGMWVRNTLNSSYDNGYGKIKIATSVAIDAYKSLYEDKESKYYVKKGESTTAFQVYNAFTEIISNKDNRDIVNKVEKTLLLKKIIDIKPDFEL